MTRWTLNQKPCGECLQFRKDLGANVMGICTKKLMTVLANEPVQSPAGESCFTDFAPTTKKTQNGTGILIRLLIKSGWPGWSISNAKRLTDGGGEMESRQFIRIYAGHQEAA